MIALNICVVIALVWQTFKTSRMMFADENFEEEDYWGRLSGLMLIDAEWIDAECIGC